MVIVANAPVILGRSDDSDDDSAGENVRSTCLDSQPSVSVVLSKTKEKIACFTADQPRQQKKHKSQSTVSDANAEVDPERIFSQFHWERYNTKKKTHFFYQKIENKYFSILKL